ncbi:hypothetical protein [Archangium sp.]|uniref:hypothetical protein n=1 Tax=Archangium sp. TaxID=1872627 RepID=UPI002D6EDC89|nr:hypothetical protein [Archangium sp.]HYO55590.1 hypothetical protein [Archangium sp.]
MTNRTLNRLLASVMVVGMLACGGPLGENTHLSSEIAEEQSANSGISVVPRGVADGYYYWEIYHPENLPPTRLTCESDRVSLIPTGLPWQTNFRMASDYPYVCVVWFDQIRLGIMFVRTGLYKFQQL